MVGTDAMLTSNIYLYKNLGFDPLKDFAPITKAADNIIVLAVNANLPATNMAELIAYAKANPGKLSFGSAGLGSPHHLAGELLKQKAGIEITHVPYKGGGVAVNDLLGGHIPMAFLSLSSAVPALPTGKIRLIATVEKTRYTGMPDLPTIGETVTGFEMSSWVGFFAPAATPQTIIARLNEQITKALHAAAVKDKMAPLGLAAIGSTPQELSDTVTEGLAVRGRLIKAAGIEAE